jgi:N-acetylglutamate synthase-like GNAT family acetyltransferase
MKISIISGSNPDIYKYVGPFAMNKAVIDEFQGYPILNHDEMIWFIVLDKKKVLAFAAIQPNKEVAEFTNAYIIVSERDKGIYKNLYEARLNWCLAAKIKKIKALCTNESISFYRDQGFTVIKSFVKWHKIEKKIL